MTWALTAASVAGVKVPSNKTRVGKLKESCEEKLLIWSAASVASAPLGKNDELLFSWTEVNFPNNGPKTPVMMNQAITTNMAMANGLRFVWARSKVTIDRPFGAFKSRIR